ncbi:MAG: dTDP-4-dehydrorhamnose 3,5-epimerase [Anaerolineales bacterium]|nr:dTDP-4-dehydrorhamnose 3,5-epimerase [Anaerolineales bacterium]
MEIKHLEIPDILLIKPDVYPDTRGFFLETYQRERYSQAGLELEFVQDNHSGSKQETLRGLHYQIKQVQGKLVSVVSGSIYDVAVDLRKSSPTFGQWVGTKLKAEDHTQLWIPPGFAHGFYVLSPWAEVTYKVTDYYAKEWDRVLVWNDPEVNIQWPLIEGRNPVLSEKDAAGLSLHEADIFE